MSGSHGLASLKRLVSLCEVDRDVAEQARIIAARTLEEAGESRRRGEEAVALAESEWQRTLGPGALGPEFSNAAAEALIARAATLGVATQRETRAQADLASADGARLESEAMLRQVAALFLAARRKERHRVDQRALARTEDRVMLRWRRT